MQPLCKGCGQAPHPNFPCSEIEPWTKQMNKDSTSGETVTIELELELIYKLFWLAHEQDITLNQLINNILRDYINVHSNQ